MSKENRWTETRVFNQLRHIWPSPAYTRIPQVRNGTGYSRGKTRTADAIVVSTWPSRGLWMAGVEIKVSVADWKKELAHPEKANAIQQYCHHWYVAVPRGLIDVAVVPETWGLVEVDGTTAEISKAAPRLEAKPIDLLLLCSILRTVEEVTTATGLVEEMIAERVEKVMEGETTRQNYEFKALQESVAAFEESSGVQIGARWDAGNIGAAVAFVRKARMTAIEGSVERLAEECEQAGERFRKALVDYKAGIVSEED